MSSVNPMPTGVSEHPAAAGEAPVDLMALKELNRRIGTLKTILNDESAPAMPSWICFATTLACNLRCPFCDTHGTPERHKDSQNRDHDLPYDRLIESANEVLPWAQEFSLTLNGEPLLTKGVDDFLQEIEHFGARLDMTTNALLLTPEMISRVLPMSARIGISVDGASVSSYAALRRGGQFARFLQRSRLLTRTIELMEEKDRPDLLIAAVIVHGNVREVPRLVELAHVLGIHNVSLRFADETDGYPSILGAGQGEFRKIFNEVHPMVRTAARRFGVAVGLPDKFPEHDLEDLAPPEGTPPPPPDVTAGEPTPWHELFDPEQIDAEARELATGIRSQIENRPPPHADGIDAATFERTLDTFEDLLVRYAKLHESLDHTTQQSVPYCHFLHQRTYIAKDEVLPCCHPGRPKLGDQRWLNVEGIYNGWMYQNFRQWFRSENMPECCNGCEYARTLDLPDPRELADVPGVEWRGPDLSPSNSTKIRRWVKRKIADARTS